MPRGFKQYEDDPLAPLLKLQGYTVRSNMREQVWLSGDIVEKIVVLAEAVGPLDAWTRGALHYELR